MSCLLCKFNPNQFSVWGVIIVYKHQNKYFVHFQNINRIIELPIWSSWKSNPDIGSDSRYLYPSFNGVSLFQQEPHLCHIVPHVDVWVVVAELNYKINSITFIIYVGYLGMHNW